MKIQVTEIKTNDYYGVDERYLLSYNRDENLWEFNPALSWEIREKLEEILGAPDCWVEDLEKLGVRFDTIVNIYDDDDDDEPSYIYYYDDADGLTKIFPED